MSMAIGIGVTVWPYAFQDMTASPYTANFWRCEDCNDVLKGVRNGVSLFLSTGYCVGSATAMFLNTILPYGEEDTEFQGSKSFDDDDARSSTSQEEESSSSEDVAQDDSEV